MSTSSILGGERAATQAEGRDAHALGPSDTSDSGSDVQGTLSAETPPMGEDQFTDTAGPANLDLSSDSDSSGTGERGAAVPGESALQGSDITPDQVTTLGGGADLLDDADAIAIREAGELEDLADVDIEEEDDLNEEEEARREDAVR